MAENNYNNPGLLSSIQFMEDKNVMPGLLPADIQNTQNMLPDSILNKFMNLLGINQAQMKDLNRDHINQMVNDILSIKPKDANWSLGLYSLGQNAQHLPDPAIRFTVPLDQYMMPVFNKNSNRI